MFVAASALAEWPRFGIQSGVPVTDFFVPGASSSRICACSISFAPTTKRFTVGPVIEQRVWRAWTVESGFLYKRTNYDFRSGSGFIPRLDATGNTAGNSREIPLLIRRPFRFRAWEVCAGAGPVLRVLGQLHQQYWESEKDFFNNVVVRRVEQSHPQEFRKRVYLGMTGAIGARVKMGPMRLGPDLRYTRWLANADGSGFPPLQFRANQVELLLGIRF